MYYFVGIILLVTSVTGTIDACVRDDPKFLGILIISILMNVFWIVVIRNQHKLLKEAETNESL